MQRSFFPEARKIVEARYNVGGSYASKANPKTIHRKDAQTQTVDAAVQTTQDKPTDIKTTAQQKSIQPIKTNKVVQMIQHLAKIMLKSRVALQHRQRLQAARTKGDINLQIKSSQIAYPRDLTTKLNNIIASVVLMKTWKQTTHMQS